MSPDTSPEAVCQFIDQADALGLLPINNVTVAEIVRMARSALGRGAR